MRTHRMNPLELTPSAPFLENEHFFEKHNEWLLQAKEKALENWKGKVFRGLMIAVLLTFAEQEAQHYGKNERTDYKSFLGYGLYQRRIAEDAHSFNISYESEI